MDIVRCAGGECPLRGKCKRYCNIGNLGYLKSYTFNEYLGEPPFSLKNNHFSCGMFLGDMNDLVQRTLAELIVRQSGLIN